MTKLLLQLHTDVDYGMENQIPTFEDYFIESCFKIIRAQSEVIDARTKEEEQAIIEVFNEPKNPTQWTI